MNDPIGRRLDMLKWDVEQAAREIYYAMSFMRPSHPSRANLQSALRVLGVSGPHDVGLNNSVLKDRSEER